MVTQKYGEKLYEIRDSIYHLLIFYSKATKITSNDGVQFWNVQLIINFQKQKHNNKLNYFSENHTKWKEIAINVKILRMNAALTVWQVIYKIDSILAPILTFHLHNCFKQRLNFQIESQICLECRNTLTHRFVNVKFLFLFIWFWW